jgi:hypothetical protein
MGASGPVTKRPFKWRYLFLGFFAAGFLLVVALVLSLLPGREVQLIRGAVAGAHSGEAKTKISFGLGWPVLGLARFVTTFTRLDADVKSVLQAVRQADVSIQELAGNLGPGERNAVLEATDQTMARNGWERMVGAVEGDEYMGDEVIGIYVPANLKAEDELRVALFVLEGRELITVSARCRLEPLWEVAERHGAFQSLEGH